MIDGPYISWLTSACVFDSSHVCHWIERWYSPVSFVRCVATMQVRVSVSRTCTNLDTRRNRNNLCTEPSPEWSRTLALEIHHYNFEINARSTIVRREMKKRRMTRRCHSRSASVGMSPIRVIKICVYLKVGKYISRAWNLSLVYKVCISDMIAWARGDFLIYTVKRLRVRNPWSLADWSYLSRANGRRIRLRLFAAGKFTAISLDWFATFIMRLFESNDYRSNGVDF